MPRWSCTFPAQFAAGWEVRKSKLSQVVSKVCTFTIMYKEVNYIVCRSKRLKTNYLAISEAITRMKWKVPLEIWQNGKKTKCRAECVAHHHLCKNEAKVACDALVTHTASPEGHPMRN